MISDVEDRDISELPRHAPEMQPLARALIFGGRNLLACLQPKFGQLADLPTPFESVESAGMRTRTHPVLAHPSGEQPAVEVFSATADTFAGRIHIEWDRTASVTPLGQLPFFIDYLKQAGLFDAWVADCPLSFTSPNAPKKRDLLGTVMLSVLSGHRRYAHVTALRCDPVNPPLLGMGKIVSEDAVRRGLAKIDEAKGLGWLQNHLDYCTAPLLSEPWVLDMDSTVKTLYGHQEGAEIGYNPAKPGSAIPRLPYLHALQPAAGAARRRSAWRRIQRRACPLTDYGHCWIISVQHAVPALLRGDKSWGVERVMSRAERNDMAYLFRLRMTANVKRDLVRAMRHSDW